MTWLRPVKDAPDDVAGLLAVRDDGHCVFHTNGVLSADSEKGPAPFSRAARVGCSVQAALGHDSIPLACQHFPRVCLIDARGVFVTVSHYCPTAASLLFEVEESPVTVVEGPPALFRGQLPEGLDARNELPPLRKPRLLMDLQEYDAWEREAVRTLTTSDPAERTLDELSRRITNGAGPFSEIAEGTLFAMAREAVPMPYSWPEYTQSSGAEQRSFHAVVGRYLAAHAFASWTAYQGNGLLSILTYLRLVLAVLRTETARHASLLEGIRQADLLLRHLVDRQALASRIASHVERFDLRS